MHAGGLKRDRLIRQSRGPKNFQKRRISRHGDPRAGEAGAQGADCGNGVHEIAEGAGVKDQEIFHGIFKRASVLSRD
jgi:hypothetical protein